MTKYIPIIFLPLLSLLIASTAFASQEVKEADLAGTWYPASKKALAKLLQAYIDAAKPNEVKGRILAIISPHAGYQFSAPVAAYGYKLASGKDIKTVIIIGFSHRKAFDGIAIYDRGVFRTPLGEVPVNADLAGSIETKNKRIYYHPEAFSDENSIEMQIPFIQMSFPNASIVPIAFGTQEYQDAEILADALSAVLKGRTDCLMVASTDLSHYHPYEDANVIDKRFIDAISSEKPERIYLDERQGKFEACGIMPITSVLLTADKLGYNGIKVLKYANSGDTFLDKSRVVGYLSAAIYKGAEQPPTTAKEMKRDSMRLTEGQRKRLLEIARGSIISYVKEGKRKNFTENDAALNEPLGAFVTIHENGELRGCIGNMMATGPLYSTIANMAVEAATGDPRFPALSPDEIDKIDLEISVLSPMKKISSVDEIKIPGHGVLVRRGFSSGVYLPQVATETGWSKEEFMTSLCAHKAGLEADAWKDPSTEIYIFSAEVFGEKGKQ